MTNNNADVPGDAGDGEPTLPRQLPHVSYNPIATSAHDAARQQKALRRMYHHRNLPAWTKKISWFLFPVYGLMRLHDPNYEEHYAQWDEQRRRDYGG
jgi:hypothetical protein